MSYSRLPEREGDEEDESPPLHHQIISSRNTKFKKSIQAQLLDDQKIEILVSVFVDFNSSIDVKGKGKQVEEGLDHDKPLMNATEFAILVEGVREAIDKGVLPRLNSKGSSGSYFARDVNGGVSGIFKPADEEPYGRLNPKTLKWIHRNFLSRVIPFGRSCLIPQLSYLSESACSILDRRLGTNIVPRTEVVNLSSTAFYYDWLDRDRATKGRELPQKAGSFQVFLDGFSDASNFLNENPFPHSLSFQNLEPVIREPRVDFCLPFKLCCGRAEAEDDRDRWGWGEEEGREMASPTERFVWTEELQASFRKELEKLVILDYLMRNTDRGLDNFMIKVCSATTDPHSPPHVHLAAIDNSLSFPHEHPASWRSYAYGWLYLPASIIGGPFHLETREKYLPLLTSPAWWSETMFELRKEFKKDPGFNETMFQKQMSVVKGQGWNLVQSLIGEEGPLELCRRGSKLVKDQYHWVDEQFSTNPVPLISPSISSPPVTHSFPPEIPIPIPFKKKQSTSIKSSNSEVEVYGSLTGVSILAQMDEEEKAARRSFGNARKIEEEEEAENENVESSGRIVEESNKVVDGDSNWKDKIRDTLSFDVERIPVLKRARSSGSFSIRRGHSRNTSRADEAWLHEIEGKKLVVFESLESIEVKPFFRDW